MQDSTSTSSILAGLNPDQNAAVTAPDGNILVLAGAGSGKTRVLIHRMAWLHACASVPPHSMLALTFTNKAANEMRQRLHAMVSGSAWSLAWLGTFHGIANRLLRKHHLAAGLASTFTILDADDAVRLTRRILVDMGKDTKTTDPHRVATWISRAKDDGLAPSQAKVASQEERDFPSIYAQYEARLARSGSLDFGGLLLNLRNLLARDPTVAAACQSCFGHILVDEFQDTNLVQYEILVRLTGSSGKVFAVGDDSQSIYGWRGARPHNMHRFLNEFPGTALMRLEQNYRSFPAILASANALIGHNQSQLPKRLWTARGDVEKIRVMALPTEGDEAQAVVDSIRSGLEAGASPSDFVILYRVNAQSRPFEEALLAAGLPYRLTGGVRFFERAEIKDAMAWLRLAVSERDDCAFERAICAPARGIGAKTLETITRLAAESRISQVAAARLAVTANRLPTRATTAVCAWLKALDALVALAKTRPLPEVVLAALRVTGLETFHAKYNENTRGVDRVANLGELVSVARRFVAANQPHGAPAPDLTAFLTHVALEASEAAPSRAPKICVELMTLHSSKGLEFPHVFIGGWEDGMLPSARALREGAGAALEEERRLAYVGITRAQRHLTLTCAASRLLFGQRHENAPSRFLSELPQDQLLISAD